MAESLPKITVITVTFNLIKDGREAVFRQCVESIHNQTYPNIEHIVMDGASTDGTLDLIREYEEKGWLKCYSEPDEGKVDAMNKGIKAATSDYIMILNSDDYYENNAVELLYKKLVAEQADYVFSSTHLINKDGTDNFYWQASDFCVPLFFAYTPFNHETMICKKSVYEALDPDGYYYHYKEFGTAADYEFCCRLILADYKPAFLGDALLHFRMDGDSSPQSRESMTETQKKHLSFHVKTVVSIWKRYFDEKDIIYSSLNQKNIYYDSMNKFLSDNLYSIKFRFATMGYLSQLHLKNYDYNLLISYFSGLGIQEKNILPLLKIKTTENTTRIYLLSFLPLLKIRKKAHTTRFYLFGFLRIFKRKNHLNNK